MKIVLLDRDGTVAAEPDDRSIDSEAKIHIWADTMEALKHLADNGFAAIFVTNQTAIAQGLMDTKRFWDIHEVLLDRLKPSGLRILKTYLCEHDDEDNCLCRKPKPGLLQQAVEEFGLTTKDIFWVGDRPSDVQAGQAAGLRTILVKTSELSECPEHIQPDHVVDSLLNAARLIVAADKKQAAAI